MGSIRDKDISRLKHVERRIQVGTNYKIEFLFYPIILEFKTN